MSLETISKKRNRVYARQFDHEEAQRLRAEDPTTWTWRKLAEHFGVSETAVQRVCVPEVRERLDNANRQAALTRRRPCKGGCGRLVWWYSPNSKRSGYCTLCLTQLRQENVREGELRCTKCGEWKPDSEFAVSKRHVTRRHRKTQCRPCATAVRQAYRERHRKEEAAYSNLRYHAITKHDRIERRQSMAEYIVLRVNGNGYEEVERVEATTPEGAVEQAVTEAGKYIGVLASRFQVMEVEPRTVMKVVVG